MRGGSTTRYPSGEGLEPQTRGRPARCRTRSTANTSPRRAQTALPDAGARDRASRCAAPAGRAGPHRASKAVDRARRSTPRIWARARPIGSAGDPAGEPEVARRRPGPRDHRVGEDVGGAMASAASPLELSGKRAMGLCVARLMVRHDVQRWHDAQLGHAATPAASVMISRRRVRQAPPAYPSAGRCDRRRHRQRSSRGSRMAVAGHGQYTPSVTGWPPKALDGSDLR